MTETQVGDVRVILVPPKMEEIEEQIYEILKRHEELTLEEMKDLLRPILYYFDEDVFETKKDLLLGFTTHW